MGRHLFIRLSHVHPTGSGCCNGTRHGAAFCLSALSYVHPTGSVFVNGTRQGGVLSIHCPMSIHRFGCCISTVTWGGVLSIRLSHVHPKSVLLL
ncbi:hypothetical protein AVEN_117441-1 [Araneus ventricosus]|uniref:Uncharacterized protein n=1 Tax=Araneus ventricosus TaxID=182803 RepID=A0A4Y2X9F4_ARAVE|nr:hypothetical protein AVEN_117441-1 [Araneus ventricosus]